MSRWFRGKVKNALVVMPREDAQRVASIDPNGNTPIHQGIAQQVASLGANQTFEIEHVVTHTGAKIKFSKSSHPPMVRPMNDGPTWEDFHDLEERLREMERTRSSRPHRTKYEASHDYLGDPMGPMLVDGGPGFVFRDASGRFKAYRITPLGFEFARELKQSE